MSRAPARQSLNLGADPKLSGGEGDEEDDENVAVEDGILNIKNALKIIPTNSDDPWILGSVWFQVSVNLLTLLNTIQMGFEADHPDWIVAWRVCENLFTAGFFFEMVLKIYLLRKKYFLDKANWLDGFLSCLGVLDCWIFSILPIGGGGGASLQSLSILRILRLLRLARILKLVRNVKPLVLVIQGVLGAVSTTMYVFAMLVLIFYIFAIFLTEHLGRGDALDIYPGYAVLEEVIDENAIMLNYNPHMCFGSMPRSMLTLFNMALFAEWAEVVRPVAQKQPVYVAVFIVFALLVGFGVMNVMIGVIVDSVIAESKRIDECCQEQIKLEKMRTLEKVQELLNEIDGNGDGTIELNELAKAMKTHAVLNKLLSNIDLPSGWSSAELLSMLDNSGDGILEKSEFTTSFFRLMESDSFQQICIMQASINQVKHNLRDGHLLMHRKFDSINAEFKSLKTAMDSTAESLRHILADNQAMAAWCEKHCNAEVSESMKGVEMSIDELAAGGDAAGGLCNELKHKIEPAMRDQFTETLDLAKEAARDSAGKPLLWEKLESTPYLLNRDLGEGNVNAAPDNSRLNAADLGSTRTVCNAGGGTRTLENYAKGQAGPEHISAATPSGKYVSAEGTWPHLARDHGNPWSSTIADGHSLSIRTEDHSRLDSADGELNDFQSVASASQAGEAACHPCPPMQSDLVVDKASCGKPVDLHAETLCPLPSDTALTQSRSDPSYELIFDDGTPQLGFAVYWVQGDLPLVGRVSPGGAACTCGVLPGDRLVECNGIPTAGKDRQEMLQLLQVRPLCVRMFRTNS